MHSLEDLIMLVQSLSKSERRYIALFGSPTGGDKAYWQLYELIYKHTEPKALQRAFLEQHAPLTLEPACRHLYRTLMKCLRGYHANQSVQQRLLGQMQDIEILFNRGFVAASLTELNRAKQLALKHEKFAHFLWLAHRERQFLTEAGFGDLTEADLVARQETTHDVLYHQLFISKHAALLENLLHRYQHSGHTRSPQDDRKLNDLLLEEHQVNRSKRRQSFESDKLHLHFQAAYFLMTGQFNESLKLYTDLERLFDAHRTLWTDEPLYVTNLLNGILTGLRSTRNYPAMRVAIERLRELAAQYPNRRKYLVELALSHELSLFIDQGAFAEGLVELHTYRTTEQSVASRHPATLLLFQSALLYFGAGQFTRALAYVNQALNTSAASLSGELYTLFRLLNLLIHIELENHDLLHYEIKSVERTLKKQQKLFQVERVLLNFLKKYIETTYHTDLLTKLSQQLTALANQPHEGQLLRYLDLISWANAKLHRLSLQQVIHTKYKT